jgi:hypothetical protein
MTKVAAVLIVILWAGTVSAATAPRFTDKGNGTIRDNVTGLIWLKNADCPNGVLIWQDALDFVAGINSGANDCGDTSRKGSHQTDWRVPTVKEVFTLLDYSQFDPAVPPHPFSNLTMADYWTSTTFAFDPDWAWSVAVDRGFLNTLPKNATAMLIAVRGHQ